MYVRARGARDDGYGGNTGLLADIRALPHAYRRHPGALRPRGGIVFDDAPDLTGEEAEVCNWIASYQKAFWQTLRTNEVSGTFSQITSAEMQDVMARIASNNAADGARIGGTFRTRISDITVTGDTATGVKCDDFRSATFADNTGELSVEEAGQDIPQRGKVELIRLEGGVWWISKVVGDGTC